MSCLGVPYSPPLVDYLSSFFTLCIIKKPNTFRIFFTSYKRLIFRSIYYSTVVLPVRIRFILSLYILSINSGGLSSVASTHEYPTSCCPSLEIIVSSEENAQRLSPNTIRDHCDH